MEEIKSNDGSTIAIVIRNDFNKDGYNFVSKEDFPLQLGLNSYKKGDRIKAHTHFDVPTLISSFQEIIFMKSGKALAKLYDAKKELLKSVELSSGDLIFLVSGGHSFEILEDTKIIEVKQGPYFGKEQDKVVF